MKNSQKIIASMRQLNAGMPRELEPIARKIASCGAHISDFHMRHKHTVEAPCDKPDECIEVCGTDPCERFDSIKPEIAGLVLDAKVFVNKHPMHEVRRELRFMSTLKSPIFWIGAALALSGAITMVAVRWTDPAAAQIAQRAALAGTILALVARSTKSIYRETLAQAKEWFGVWKQIEAVSKAGYRNAPWIIQTAASKIGKTAKMGTAAETYADAA